MLSARGADFSPRVLGGSFELLRQKVAASDNAWQLRYQAEGTMARESI